MTSWAPLVKSQKLGCLSPRFKPRLHSLDPQPCDLARFSAFFVLWFPRGKRWFTAAYLLGLFHRCR